MTISSRRVSGVLLGQLRSWATRASLFVFLAAGIGWSASAAAFAPTLYFVQPSSGSITIPQNSSTVLKVSLSDGSPLSDEQIYWSVPNEPTVGDLTFTGETSSNPSQVSSTTDAGGVAQAEINVTEAGTYTVQADWCPDGCYATIQFTITVNRVGADLSITKTVRQDPVAPGGQLNYAITVTNSGPETAFGVTMTDVLPSDLTFDSLAVPPTWSCTTPAVGTNGTITCTKAKMPVGSVNFRIVATVAPTASDGSSISNTATVTSQTPDAGPGNESATAYTRVSGVSAKLLKGSGDGQTTPVNTPFPQPLTVIANDPSSSSSRTSASFAGIVASGITINWSVISGSATLSGPSSVTNSLGVASIIVTAGPVAGPIVIRATRADDPSAQVTFNLTSTDTQASLADLPGLTPSELAVARALDELCSSINGGGSTSPSLAATNPNTADLAARCEDLIAAIGSDPDGVINALDQLFADIALVQSESALLAMQSQFENIKARIAALRSGTRGTSFGGLAFNNTSGSLPIGVMFQSLLDGDAPASKEVGTDFSRWGFFAAGTVSRGSADPGVVSPGYDFQINGLTLGADYRVSDKLIFGGTVGYTKQDNDLTGREGNLQTTGWSVSGYGTYYQSNSWYTDAVLTYGRNNYQTERHVIYTLTFPNGSTSTINQFGRADSSGNNLSLAASFGRDFNRGGWGFGPYFRAMYTRLDFDPLVEDFSSSSPGSGLALVMDTRSVTSVSSTLGGKLTYAHSASWGVLIPHLQLEWQHEFKTDPSAVEAHFLYDPSATPFTIHGDPVDTDFFRFGVGMSFVMTHGRSGFFYFEHLLSRDRFSQNSLAFGLRLEF